MHDGRFNTFSPAKTLGDEIVGPVSERWRWTISNF